MSITEQDKVGLIPGVGPVAVAALANLGIISIADLLRWYPREYLDGSNPLPIRSVPLDRLAAIKVQIESVTLRPTKQRGLSMLEAVCTDESGKLHVRWFNQPYLKQKLLPGTQWVLMGTVQRFGPQLSMMSPILEFEPRILAIYGQTKGVTSKMLRGWLQWVITHVALEATLLPSWFMQEEQLIDRQNALQAIHTPLAIEQVEPARHYFAFEEAFAFFARMALAKQETVSEKGVNIQFDVHFLQDMVAKLSFELTAGQKRAIWDCVQEMHTGKPMTRLLNGDVGSGKTMVAAFASAVVAKSGYQSVLLVPTEILAQQHRLSIAEFLEPLGITVAVWTAAHKESTEADLVIGTHAVLQQDFSMPRLGLVIIDEQHRFGVRQRQLLRAGTTGAIPHLLSMTATPIPRTLALALYGDLTVSLLPDKPKDRLPISTEVIVAGNREHMHNRIVAELQSGHQVFVICPLIESAKPRKNEEAEEQTLFTVLSQEELATAGQKTVLAEAAQLHIEHPEYGRIEVLHGKMKPALKQQIMEQMAAGEINVLVATSVVEVGVNIPNATVMVIEGAERFGLAQLHQFRGRVGRSSAQSYCFLCPQLRSLGIMQRLAVLEKEQSGFAVAEQDLALRGPGELSGSVQAGLPDFKMASLTDIDFLRRVHTAVLRQMQEDPGFMQKFSDTSYSTSSVGLE